MSISFFQKLSYQTIKNYHRCVIVWNHYVYNPIKRAYDNAMSNSIVRVYEYNEFSLQRKMIFDYNIFQILYFMMLIWFNKKSQSRYWQVTMFPAPRTKHTIYEIVCWDGRRYLTRTAFSMAMRHIPARTTVLYAYLNNIDVTKFINKYAGSFTLDHNFTVNDILPVLFVNSFMSSRQAIEAMRSEISLNVMDANTLNEITFKDNHPLIL